MKHVAFLSTGVFLSFSVIEILYSESLNYINIFAFSLPLIFSILAKWVNQPFKAIVFMNTFLAIKLTYDMKQHIIFDRFSATALVYLIILIVFAIKSNNIKPNESFGIRTRATLKYNEVWYRTHNCFSHILCLFIPFCYTLIFWYDGWTRFILTNIALVIPCAIVFLISHIIAKPYIESDYKLAQNELKHQIKLEEEGKLK